MNPSKLTCFLYAICYTLMCITMHVNNKPVWEGCKHRVQRGASTMVSTRRVMMTGFPRRLHLLIAAFCTTAVFSGVTSKPRLPLLCTHTDRRHVLHMDASLMVVPGCPNSSNRQGEQTGARSTLLMM